MNERRTEPMPTIAPVTRSVTVSAPNDRAFEVFTRGIDRWWPSMTHSIGQSEVAEVIFEGGIGGRILERRHDGREYEWGRVEEWDPPRRVRFTWRPNPEPGEMTVVEVTFTAVAEGTQVELVHSAWERLGEEGAEMRKNYNSGWVPVLVAFAEAASA